MVSTLGAECAIAIWFLPRDDSNADAAGAVLVSPEAARPLSGSNTDAELFAFATRAGLENAVASRAHPS